MPQRRGQPAGARGAAVREPSTRPASTTELVLVDDGSTDGTWDAIAACAERPANGSWASGTSENRGIAAAWRSGVDAARGRLRVPHRRRPAEPARGGRHALPASARVARGHRAGHSLEHRAAARLAPRCSRGVERAAQRRLRDLGEGHASRASCSRRRPCDRRRRHATAAATATSRPSSASPRTPRATRCSRSRRSSRAASPASRSCGRRRSACQLGALADFLRAPRGVPASRRHRTRRVDRRRSVAVPRPAKHPYRGWRRLWFEAYFATMPLHEWLIRASPRDLYLELKQTEWSRGTRSTSSSCASSSASSSTRTSTCRYYRDAMRTAGVAPGGDPDARRHRRGCRCSRRTTSAASLYFDLFADNHDKRRHANGSPRAARPASPSRPTPTGTSSRCAARRRCARWSGRAGASATARRASGTRRSA